MKSTSDLIYLLTSVFMHLLVALVLLLKVFIFPMERPEYIQSVRVDLVALPDKDPKQGAKETSPPAEEKVTPESKESKTQEEPKAPPKEENVFVDSKKPKSAQKDNEKSAEKKNQKEALKKVTDQQNAALDRLKALSKIKDLKNKQAATKAIAESQQYKGNILSEGNSLKGVEKLQHDQYLSKLDAHIKNNWKLPAWLTNKPYSTAVLVTFDEKGFGLEKKILRSSGNSAYDEAALQAIADSAPFPEPPEHLVNYFKVRGIELRFPE